MDTIRSPEDALRDLEDPLRALEDVSSTGRRATSVVPNGFENLTGESRRYESGLTRCVITELGPLYTVFVSLSVAVTA